VLDPNVRILVVAAHADDEAIGTGGLLTTHKGPKHVLIMTDPGSLRKTQLAMMKATEEAAAFSGYELTISSYLDQSLDQIPAIELNRHIEAVVASFKPDVVLTHTDKDNNRDHVLVHAAVNVAARTVPNVLYFRIPSMGEKQGFSPSVYYPCDEAKKRKLLDFYGIEIMPSPHPRSYRNIASIDASNGNNLNLKYAEAYEIGRLCL
jgi:LmbE family N-acetylglucosaminyl deacetylase